MRIHLPASDDGVMDPAPARYAVGIHGHHGATALSAAGDLPRAGADHSHRGREVPLGMPSVRAPAKLCDLSPLAGTA